MSRTIFYWALLAVLLVLCVVMAAIVGGLISWLGTLFGLPWTDMRFFVGWVASAWFFALRVPVRRFAYDEADRSAA